MYKENIYFFSAPFVEFTKPLHDVEIKEKESAKFECEVSRESAKVFFYSNRVKSFYRAQRSETISEAVKDLHFKFTAIFLISNYIISIAMLVKTELKYLHDFQNFIEFKMYFILKTACTQNLTKKEWINS